ncbi:sensor histidine kinase [Dinghuibacter silviterrae]|uniref:Histidine kinase n=1 Tax=Dinghuibacter silviterrae TaxID=1539049 RepID=A0A4R8DXD7_9BACT|nr:histidine kinase [Dinghuibacter silviterrae]TDX02205.1 histidine kinase [Dinghuibacter silviterrae]
MKKEWVSGRIILNIVLHVAAWSAFTVLLYLLMNGNLKTPNELALKNNPYYIFNQVFTNAFLVMFYYLNAFVLIPRFLANKRILLYALIVIGLLAIYLYVPEYVFVNFITHHHPAPPPGMPPGGPPRRRFRIFPYLGSAALFLLVLVISSGSKILQQWFAAERQKEKAEKETLRTELSLLKSQINPHFLFNTLNNIYAMAITDSVHTADAVMKLSQIMRYILQEADHELVPLQKDLEFLQRYIELQQFRLSDKVDLKYQVSGDGQLLRIAPLLMIPFIENAFKYGVSAREKSSIKIDIQIRENIVTLWVENTKHAVNTMGAMENTGIGINNARRRLALLYPDRHELTIRDTPSLFVVTLKITCG